MGRVKGQGPQQCGFFLANERESGFPVGPVCGPKELAEIGMAAAAIEGHPTDRLSVIVLPQFIDELGI